MDCAFDPLGRLARGCGGWELGYDGQNVSRTVNDSSSGWTFVHGPGTDDPVLGHANLPTGSTARAYFIGDGTGRLHAVTERDGTSLRGGGELPSVQQQAYREWGGAYSGGTSSSASFNAERFESAAQSGLSFFRNRVYDQATGRWTQEDPIGIAGGLNLYQFNGNNPVSFSDPFGTCPRIEINGKNITISANVVLEHGGTPEDLERIKKYIEEAWTGHKNGGYHVSVNLSDPSAPVIKLTVLPDVPLGKRANGQGWTNMPWKSGGGIEMPTIQRDRGAEYNLAAHEFGHVMGLEDIQGPGANVMNKPVEGSQIAAWQLESAIRRCIPLPEDAGKKPSQTSEKDPSR